MPGLLHAAFVRSPHPHAAIRSVTKTAALALPGVHAVLTLDDLAPVLAKRRMMRHSNSGTPLDRMWSFALADGEVSYVGETVAIVIADDRYIAEDAAALVEVDYDVLPAVADCRKAVEPGAPRGPARAQLQRRRHLQGQLSATPQAAFGKAAHVFHEDLWQHRGAGHPIEGRGILAEYRAPTTSITVWASTQKSHDLFQSLTALLDLDEARLRVAAPDIGGGFGPKLCVYSEDIAVVAAARLMRRSIKWIEDRREHFTNAAQERDQYWSIDIAVDGRWQGAGHARRARSRRRRLRAAGRQHSLQLRLDDERPLYGAVAVDGRARSPPPTRRRCSSIRGAGYPQAAFAMERMMDRVARELELDRAEVRRRNLIPAEKMPYTKPLKARSGAAMQYDSGDYPACQAMVLDAAGWDDFPHGRRQRARRAAISASGLRTASRAPAAGRSSPALVRVSNTGRVTVFTGAAAIGQGLQHRARADRADELGLRARGDQRGARRHRQASRSASARLPAARPSPPAPRCCSPRARSPTRRRSSRATCSKPPSTISSWRTARCASSARRSFRSSSASSRASCKGAPGYGFPPGVEPGLEANVNWRTDALAYANACHVAEVEVDIETGGGAHPALSCAAGLRHADQSDDGRRARSTAALAHGIGNALFEWMGYDDDAPAGDHDLRGLSAADRDRDADDDDAVQRRRPRRSTRSAPRARAK